VVPSLPGLDKHKEVAEEGSTEGHTYEHLTEVDEDGHLEDGVGREVLKLKPELLQQQQEEGRDRQRQPARDVGGEQHKLPGGEIAEGGSTGTDSSGEPWRAPPEQAAHQIKRFLRLKAVGMTKRSHGKCGGASVEQRSTKAKRRSRLEENAKKVTTARRVNPFSRKPKSSFRETLPRAPESPQKISLDGYLGPRQASL
jgi:hypothetical protein